MAKRFQFDDEEDIQETFQEPSHIDTLEDMKESSSEVITKEYHDDENIEYKEDVYDKDDQPMAKKKKFVWKWWHYALIALTALLIAFAVYIFVLSSNAGPVYGPRCEGVTEIAKDLQTAASDTIKTKYSEIESISMEITCKQLKVDIAFKEGTKTKDAQSIAEEAVQTLDGLVGATKEEGKTYSTLFGKINNVSQYEVNLYLTCADNEDFPIYGTKHVQKDSFSYTLESIRDEESYKQAQETLED